ncbi:FadR/GntR family transcriptional regulator [Celeribacter ethanolicus]|uniref:FadR/GntR family transcriptional regulator n=1 Tax=Celeribacter ethanolicus TaxID=1758178 RepID=UPI0009D680B7|nr:FadR/GntR family transcriptional regulator [Celeribacter ethanolicus]
MPPSTGQRLSGQKTSGPKHKLTPPRSYASKVADILRREIEQNVFRPGERLPTEAVLGETFGVSRAVIREAIFALKQDGIVQSYQGRGIFVVDELPEASFCLARTELDDKEEIERVFEFLLAHEASAAALAAQRRSPADLDAIGAALGAIDAAIARGENGIEQDMAFHSEILKATGNHLFISFGAFLENRVRHLIRQARTNSSRKGLTDLVQDEHRAIFAAIEAGDAERAREAAASHLKNAAMRLTLYMQDT